MLIKQNEPTPNRPKGGRPLDAPWMINDIDYSLKQMVDEKAWHTNDRNGITLFKSGDYTVVLTALHKDASLENEKAKGFLQVQVLAGRVSLRQPAMGAEITKGQLVVIHDGIEFSIVALEESVILITNSMHETNQEL